MQPTEQRLRQIVQTRIRTIGAEEFVERASEVIVFGSVAMGLQKTDSDVEIPVFLRPALQKKKSFHRPDRSPDSGVLKTQAGSRVSLQRMLPRMAGGLREKVHGRTAPESARSIVNCKCRRVHPLL